MFGQQLMRYSKDNINLQTTFSETAFCNDETRQMTRSGSIQQNKPTPSQLLTLRVWQPSSRSGISLCPAKALEKISKGARENPHFSKKRGR